MNHPPSLEPMQDRLRRFLLGHWDLWLCRLRPSILEFGERCLETPLGVCHSVVTAGHLAAGRQCSAFGFMIGSVSLGARIRRGERGLPLDGSLIGRPRSPWRRWTRSKDTRASHPAHA